VTTHNTHKETDIHALLGIRTRNTSMKTASDHALDRAATGSAILSIS